MEGRPARRALDDASVLGRVKGSRGGPRRRNAALDPPLRALSDKLRFGGRDRLER